MPATTKQWTELVEDMTELPHVTAGKMFGSPGLRTGKKFFAMHWEDKLVIKLPKDRVEAAVNAGAEPVMQMPGRVMCAWVVIGKPTEWSDLAEEARTNEETTAAG